MRMRIYVYACPAPVGIRRRVAGALAGFDRDWVPRGGSDTGLDLTAAYTHDNVPSGTIVALTDELVGVTPKISFMAWAGPDANGLGILRAYTRRLGLFTSACDAAGTVLLTYDELDEAAIRRIRRTDRSAEALIEAVDKAFGGPHHRDWDKARRQAGVRLL
jgi:hypothetical protein